MSDLVERLQDEKFWYTPHGKGRPMRHVVAKEAADEIERLRADVKLLSVAAQRADNIEKHRDELRAALERARMFIEENMRHTAITVIDEALDGE